MSRSTLLNAVEKQRGRLVDRLGEFVTQESGTHDRADVDALGRMLRARLERLEFDVEMKPSPKFGSHLIGRRPSGNRKNLLLVGHFDTVWPHGTIKERPFRVDGLRRSPCWSSGGRQGMPATTGPPTSRTERS
jgi:glutamate carboxypeptidase